jgi:apolipoprotein D and lipocalin family protein
MAERAAVAPITRSTRRVRIKQGCMAYMFNLKSITLALCLFSLGQQASLATSPVGAAGEPLKPIAALDVPRYMGTWYEIAKYPNWFQKKCVSDTQAEYSLLPTGQVQVINRCRESNGMLSEAIGRARQVGEADSAQLEVRFAPSWLSLLPFVWGDYWVIDLDPDYQLVAVSEPEREYLWVLSRTPVVDEADYARLLARLKARGFELERLELTRQERKD